jgi:hypothetical protein
MAKITLEIIGVYFKRELDLPGISGEQSVKEVMDLFIARLPSPTEPGGLFYDIDEESKNPMKIIRHNFPGGKSRSGKFRNAGFYELKEAKTPDRKIVYAWQYYVIDENYKSRSETPPGEKFTSFIDAKFEFKDGWKILWRQVAIVLEPNTEITA